MHPIAKLSAVFALALTTPAWAALPLTIEASQPTTRPAPATMPVDWTDAVLRSARAHPADVQAQLQRQLLHLLRNEPALASNELAGLAPEDRDLVVAITRGLIGFGKVTGADASATLAEKIQPMLEMADRLRDRANLAVNHLTLCQSVERFGVCEPLAATALTTGTRIPVIVYFEVANFHPRKTDDGMWETNLNYELGLCTQTEPAVPVFSKPVTPVIDRCRTRRRDFFLADKVTFQANLPAGHYLLKVTITDQQAHRIGEATLPVDFAARH